MTGRLGKTTNRANYRCLPDTIDPRGPKARMTGGSASEPWRAVQRAAWGALTEEVKLIASSRELPGQIQPHHTTYEG